MNNGYAPVIKSAQQHPVYAQFLANADGGDYISALSAKVCLEQEDYYFTSPAFYGSSTARDEVGNLMCKIFALPDENLDAEVDKAFAAAIGECEYNG